jgi:hypothetical protein
LRFIQNDKGMIKCPASHKGKWGNFNDSVGDKKSQFFGRQHIVKRIIKRPEIGVDFLFHVAGKETKVFSCLNGRSCENDFFD